MGVIFLEDRNGGEKIDSVDRVLQCSVNRVVVAAFQKFGAHQRPQTVTSDLIGANAEGDQRGAALLPAGDFSGQLLRQKRLLYIF